jgi:hypothetical protein
VCVLLYCHVLAIRNATAEGNGIVTRSNDKTELSRGQNRIFGYEAKCSNPWRTVDCSPISGFSIFIEFSKNGTVLFIYFFYFILF